MSIILFLYETPKISTKRGTSGLFKPVASKQPVLMGHRHLNLKDGYQNLSFCHPYWDKRYTALLEKKKYKRNSDGIHSKRMALAIVP